jgi:hypothetical protein
MQASGTSHSVTATPEIALQTKQNGRWKTVCADHSQGKTRKTSKGSRFSSNGRSRCLSRAEQARHQSDVSYTGGIYGRVNTYMPFSSSILQRTRSVRNVLILSLIPGLQLPRSHSLRKLYLDTPLHLKQFSSYMHVFISSPHAPQR